MKSLLLKDRELSKWWQSFVTHDNFEKVSAFARSEFFSHVQGQERNLGAEAMLTMLTHFAENESEAPPFPTPGLQHQMPPKPQPEKKT